MNIFDSAVWQAIQVYKMQAIDPENPFTEEQRNDLLEIAETAEKKSEGSKLKNLKKLGLLLQEYDTKYEHYGGDMDILNEKIDEIYNPINKSLKIDKMIEFSEKTATMPGKTTRKIKGMIRRNKR